MFLHSEELIGERQKEAHCIRNSLNAIKGAVFYLMEKYADHSTIKEFMQIATDEIKRIDRSVSDLLVLSKHNNRVMETDVNQLIEKLLFFASYQFKSSNIECQTEFGNVPPIRVNPFELGQAILNVLNNSVEAMKSGGVITIETYKELLFGKMSVFLKIADTGIGFSPLEIPRSDADNSDKTGRGYGLTITRKIVEDHGGILLIQSTKGVGTTVCFCLPVPSRGGDQ